MIRVSHNQWHEPQEPGRISLRIASGISRHLSGPEPDHVSNTLLPECWLTPVDVPWTGNPEHPVPREHSGTRVALSVQVACPEWPGLS